MKIIQHTILALFIAGLLLQIGCSPSNPSFVIALKPDKDPEKMIQERKTLATYLAPLLKQPVEIIVPLSSAVIMEGFTNKTIDLAYLSSTEMCKAIDLKIAKILLVGEIKGETSYSSYWLTLKEKPYTQIQELKGMKVAFSSKTSTSGFIMPYQDLIQRSLITPKEDPENFFGKSNVWYGTGYVSAVERVLSGEAEAAAVSDYVFDQNKHLSEEQKQKLKVFQKQGPVPTHTIAIRSSLSDADQKRILEVIETLNNPENEELRNKVFTSKLVRTNSDLHLKSIREALQNIP